MKGLLYKEYYLNRRLIMMELTGGIAMAGFLILVLLSFRYGNLRFLEEGTRMDFFQIALLSVKYFPIFSFATMAAPPEAVLSEINGKWERFRLTTPVTSWKFAGVKTLFQITLLAVGLTCSLLFLGILSAFGFTDFDRNAVAGTLFVFGALLLFTTFFQMLTLFFRSLDKAGVALCVILTFLLVGVFVLAADKLPLGQDMSLSAPGLALEQKAGACLPVALLMIAAAPLLNLIGMGTLLRRREK